MTKEQGCREIVGEVLREALRGKHANRAEVLNEFGRLKPEMTENHFTVGLIRNPCSYYVSLWEFGNNNCMHSRH